MFDLPRAAAGALPHPEPVARGIAGPSARAASACADAFVSSGPSPTLFLLGAGQVGRAFLQLLGGADLRLVGAADRSGSALCREGLDPRRTAGRKAEGLPLRLHPAGVGVEPLGAVFASGARLVADALPTDPTRADEAALRLGRLLDAGCAVALASKDALGADPERFFHPALEGRLGCNAALGGAGAAIQAALPGLRAEAVEVVAVPNASTTCVLTALEAGLDLDAAVAAAQARGVLEPDPTLDLDGSDAAVKLAVVAGALSARRLPLAALPRLDLRRLDPEALRAHARAGRTTRLVARWSAAEGARLGFELLDRHDPLAVPADRVAYGFRLRDGRTRCFIGAGLGPERTAAALLADVLRLAGEAA